MDNTAKLERITPTKAEQYLNHNKGNRKLRDGVVDKYALDMKHGNWTACDQPITFYEDGEIANGQHRLWAIVESGCAVEFLVLHNFPRPAGLNVDTQIGRTIVDNARISGLDTNLSNELVALALFYEAGKRPRKGISNADRLATVDRYRVPCDWAVKHGPSGKGYRNAPTLSAIARAFAAGADPERLVRFGKVLSQGFAEGTQDSAAIALRNYIIARDRRLPEGDQREFFLKVQNAIHYFVRRKPLGVIKVVTEECYPSKAMKKALKVAA